MRRQIVFLMSGTPHLPYLVCSLYTLRRWYSGRVVIYAWPESYDFVAEIAKDHRLAVDEVYRRKPTYRKKNAQFIDKILLMQSLPGEVNLYLDADTTIEGSLTPIFDAAIDHGFAATQFCEWVSSGNIARHRIQRLRKFEGIDQSLVERTIDENWPSVNGGIFACRPDSPVLPLWYKWTMEAKGIFIADETVLHILQPKFAIPRDMITLRGGGRFNCSPKYKPKRLKPEDVVVWHFHGDSNVRPDNKSQLGHNLWWPVYCTCFARNIGGMAYWRRQISNKYMDRLEA